MQKSVRMQWAWATVYLAVLTWSGISPKEYPIWFLEVGPALIGAAVLWYTRNSFALTPLVYILILIHCIILMVGGHYTYAEVPFFDWLRDEFGLARNNYDKVGHFAQGFVPALVAREIVIRKKIFTNTRWRDFFIVCFCLGFSAFYELIEWWVALLSAGVADSFLGTQGYIWDTQSDMAWALSGALVAILFFGRWHDRQMSDRGMID